MLDLPMSSVSPFAFSTTDGTAESGARSDTEDWLRVRLPRGLGGDEERIPVLDVGTGVGYLRWAFAPVACRFAGRGRPGDEESGSKGGRRVGAGRFVPAVAAAAGGGSVGSVCLGGDESIMTPGACHGELAVSDAGGERDSHN